MGKYCIKVADFSDYIFIIMTFKVSDIKSDVFNISFIVVCVKILHEKKGRNAV